MAIFYGGNWLAAGRASHNNAQAEAKHTLIDKCRPRNDFALTSEICKSNKSTGSTVLPNAKTTAPHCPGAVQLQPAWTHHMASTPISRAGQTPSSTRIHRCSTTRASHHVLLSGTSANNTPSSLLARTPASTRFITEKAPVSQQELQPVQNSSLTPAGKNFHQQYLPAAPERSIRWLARTLSSTTTHGFTTAPETPEATLRCIDAPKPADPIPETIQK